MSKDFVHLPQLINDEFGVSRSHIRQAILMGDVFIDDVKWEGDKIDIPIEEIDGKTIVVTSESRHFKLDFDSSKRADHV